MITSGRDAEARPLDVTETPAGRAHAHAHHPHGGLWFPLGFGFPPAGTGSPTCLRRKHSESDISSLVPERNGPFPVRGPCRPQWEDEADVGPRRAVLGRTCSHVLWEVAGHTGATRVQPASSAFPADGDTHTPHRAARVRGRPLRVLTAGPDQASRPRGREVVSNLPAPPAPLRLPWLQSGGRGSCLRCPGRPEGRSERRQALPRGSHGDGAALAFGAGA